VDPAHFDARVAGWWLWGACAWIGDGWCSGEGPWTSDGERWIDRRDGGNEGGGINRGLPHLGDEGMGINRKLPALGNDRGAKILAWMRQLSARLRDVRVACGDWSRVVTGAATRAGGYPCGILLDPPYPEGAMSYAAGSEGSDVWHEVRRWAEENGGDPDLRIVLCGYEGLDAPAGWKTAFWSGAGRGYASTEAALNNVDRETLWLSPACLEVEATTGRQLAMFGT
jgi:hypothetical protein